MNLLEQLEALRRALEVERELIEARRELCDATLARPYDHERWEAAKVRLLAAQNIINFPGATPGADAKEALKT